MVHLLKQIKLLNFFHIFCFLEFIPKNLIKKNKIFWKYENFDFFGGRSSRKEALFFSEDHIWNSHSSVHFLQILLNLNKKTNFWWKLLKNTKALVYLEKRRSKRGQSQSGDNSVKSKKVDHWVSLLVVTLNLWKIPPPKTE